MRLPLSTTGDRPLVIDEYRIDREPMPSHYKATFAIRYTREQFVDALIVVHAFLKNQFDCVVVTGNSGSPNGDQITVWCWADGVGRKLPTLTEQQQAADADPRRI